MAMTTGITTCRLRVARVVVIAVLSRLDYSLQMPIVK